MPGTGRGTILARTRRASALAAVAALVLALAACGDGGDGGGDGAGAKDAGGPNEPAPGAPWALLEDHQALIRSGAERREQTLRELRGLGVDTVRVIAKWNEAAPSPAEPVRPRFDASDPRAYPGFGELDDLVVRATRMGFRIVVDIAPDAPIWATEDRRPGTVNVRPRPAEFAAFAGAVAKRYSGMFEGIPRIDWYALWNEPNHRLFLKPADEAPAIYRAMVAAAVPRVRAANEHAKILVGETAAVGRAGVAMGPREFLRRWLCLDERLRPISTGACRGLPKLDVDGYAHHPYGPADRIPEKQDIVSLLVIRRLGTYLDRAASAGRLPPRLPIYSTEFGLQSNPPDPTVSTTLARQAALLNEKEELSFRYPRLRSYAQYLLFDDPPRPGTSTEQIWSGFQTGLKFVDGRPKPAYRAYRLPIVVHTVPGGVRIWGRVRPGSGPRSVQLERASGNGWSPAGRLATNANGYFEARRPETGTYRFRAFDEQGHAIGHSRAASSIP